MNTVVHVLVRELTHSWSDKRHPDSRLGLIGILEQHTQPVTMGDRSSGGGRVTGSPAPWANDVEALLTDIDAGTRDLEDTICRVLDRAHVERGGSRPNTITSLQRLPDLVDALERERPDHWLVRGERHPRKGYRSGEVQKCLSQWHHQARVLLGVERRYALWPFPCTGQLGDGDAQRECGAKALRQRPGGTAVVCGACGETYTQDELHAWFIPTTEESA